MSALTAEKSRRQEHWKYKSFTATGAKCWKGGRAALNGSGKVVPASSITALLPIGMFAETVDASSADAAVQVELDTEIVVERFVNATSTDACAATDVGALCWMMDDQTVTITAGGRSVGGRIWDVDATLGVAVQRLPGGGGALSTPAATAPATYAANDLVITAVEQDAVYDVPTTGAASTVTLPAAAKDGARVTFCADGTKNGHTVQYRDATGPTNLTTALTASKRHLVVCVKENGKWFANAYVSP